jgi:hypothetical protein
MSVSGSEQPGPPDFWLLVGEAFGLDAAEVRAVHAVVAWQVRLFEMSDGEDAPSRVYDCLWGWYLAYRRSGASESELLDVMQNCDRWGDARRRDRHRISRYSPVFRAGGWPFLRCRACAFIAQPQATMVQFEHSSIDWRKGVWGRCPICNAEGHLRMEDIVAWDAEHACRSCGAVTQCPQAAIAVTCTSCGRWGLHGIVPSDEDEYARLTGDRQAWLLRKRAAYMADKQ